jgi:hypothetical protein
MTIRKLSEVLAELKHTLSGEIITMDALLDGLHERGFGVVLLAFALPLSIPLPKPPGISTLFGIPLLVLTTQQALGRRTFWMPQFIRRRSIEKEKLDRLLDNTVPVVKKIEILVRPRLEWVTHGRFSRLIGFLGAIMAAFISIPLPGSNTIPGIGIALMAMGVMMRDGLAVIIGAVIGTGWVFGLGSFYLFFGREGLNALQNLL